MQLPELLLPWLPCSVLGTRSGAEGWQNDTRHSSSTKRDCGVCLHTAGRLASEPPAEPTTLHPADKVNCLLGFLEILLCFFPEHCSKIRWELILQGNTQFKLTLKCIQEEKQNPTCKLGIFWWWQLVCCFWSNSCTQLLVVKGCRKPSSHQLFTCLFCALQLFCSLLGCSYGPDAATIQVIHSGGLVHVAQVNVRCFGTGGTI